MEEEKVGYGRQRKIPGEKKEGRKTADKQKHWEEHSRERKDFWRNGSGIAEKHRKGLCL